MANFDNSDESIQDLKERILALEVVNRTQKIALQDREQKIYEKNQEIYNKGRHIETLRQSLEDERVLNNRIPHLEKTIEDQKNTIDLLSQIRKILIAENNELKDEALEFCSKDKEINKLQVEVNQKKWDICTLNETVDHKDHIIDRLNEEVKRLKLNPEIQDNNQMLVKFRRKLDRLKREILDLEKEFDSQLRGKYGY